MPCPNPCTCPVHASIQRRDKERPRRPDRRKRDRAAYFREYRKRRRESTDRDGQA